MTNFIPAQLVSACSMVISLTCVQFRDPRCILAGKFCVNVLGAVSFGLLDALSASWVCVVASVQTVTIFLLNHSLSLTSTLAAIFRLDRANPRATHGPHSRRRTPFWRPLFLYIKFRTMLNSVIPNTTTWTALKARSTVASEHRRLMAAPQKPPATAPTTMAGATDRS